MTVDHTSAYMNCLESKHYAERRRRYRSVLFAALLATAAPFDDRLTTPAGNPFIGVIDRAMAFLYVHFRGVRRYRIALCVRLTGLDAYWKSSDLESGKNSLVWGGTLGGETG